MLTGLVIETERLRLRPYTMGDVDVLHRLWTDPAIRKYLWDDEIITRERAEQEVRGAIACFETRGFGQWLVLEKGSPIGFCGLRPFGEPPEIEVLYGLAPEHWGRGLATEAARAVMRFAFEEHGLDRLYAGADPPNTASFRVMERLGMKSDKRLRSGSVETLYYAVSREAFPHDQAPYTLHRLPADR